MPSTLGQWHALSYKTYFWKQVFYAAAAGVRTYLSVIPALAAFSKISLSC